MPEFLNNAQYNFQTTGCTIRLDALIAPFFNLRIDLLVQIGDRAGTDPSSPESLGDVLNPTDRDTGNIHLNQGFLD